MTLNDDNIASVTCDHKLITWKSFITFPSGYTWGNMGWHAVCSKCGKFIDKSDIIKESTQ